MLQANREQAGEARLWAKTSEIYEEILADIAYRALVREQEHRKYRRDAKAEEALQAQIDAYQRGDFIRREARVRAYASDEVLERFLSATNAEAMVRRVDAGEPVAGEFAEAIVADFPWLFPNPEAVSQKVMIDATRVGADATLEALAKAIRQELRDRHQRRRRFQRRNQRADKGLTWLTAELPTTTNALRELREQTVVLRDQLGQPSGLTDALTASRQSGEGAELSSGGEFGYDVLDE